MTAQTALNTVTSWRPKVAVVFAWIGLAVAGLSLVAGVLVLVGPGVLTNFPLGVTSYALPILFGLLTGIPLTIFVRRGGKTPFFLALAGIGVWLLMCFVGIAVENMALASLFDKVNGELGR